MGSPDADDAQLLASVERSVRAQLGGTPARASVTFVGVEPIEVLRFDTGVERWYVSLGMSRRPMTGADATVLELDGPRAELAITIPASGAARPGRSDDGLWRRLAVLAAAPTVEGVVYREGMVIDLGEPLVPGSRCVGAVVGRSSLRSADHAGIEVQILRLDPATGTELAWSRLHGVPALRARWADRRVDLRDLWRAPVGLD